jgi:uncharacterized protein (DUF302 family)
MKLFEYAERSSPMEYGMQTKLDLTFEEALERVMEALKSEGFGVLTRIDIHEKLKEKLGVDFKKYVILGACHPPSAHRALLAEENIGLMLPCNVIVYEKDGATVVAAIRPSSAMGMIDNDELKLIAGDVERKLENVINSLK